MSYNCRQRWKKDVVVVQVTKEEEIRGVPEAHLWNHNNVCTVEPQRACQGFTHRSVQTRQIPFSVRACIFRGSYIDARLIYTYLHEVCTFSPVRAGM